MTLLYHPSIYEDECLLGYLTRVSERLGFRHYGYLLNYLGLGWKNNRAPVKDLLTGVHSISALLESGGLSCKTPVFSALYQKVELGISTSAFIPRFPRVCPICTRENGYIQEIWGFLPVTVCVKHGVPLVDRPFNQGNRLAWLRSRCLPDGFESWMPHLLDDKSLEVSRFFHNSLIKSNLSVPVPSLLKPLDALESLTVLNFLIYMLVKSEGLQRFNITSMPIDMLSKNYGKAWEILLDWPSGYFNLLTKFKESPQQANWGTSGIRKYYRDIYDRLYKSKNYPGMDRLFLSFQEYVQTQPQLLRFTDRVSRMELNTGVQSDVVKLSEAKKLLQCRDTRLNRLVERGDLELIELSGYKYISFKSLKKYQTVLAESYSFSELCDILDLGRYQVLALLRAGYFKVHQRAEGKDRDWIVFKEPVHNRISELRSLHIEPDESRKIYTMSGFSKLGNSIVDIVSGIENQKVCCRFSLDTKKPYSLKQFSDFQEVK